MNAPLPAACPPGQAVSLSESKWHRVGEPDRAYATAGDAARFFLEQMEEDLGPDTNAILALLDQYPPEALTWVCKRPEDTLQYAWVKRLDGQHYNVAYFGTDEEKQAALKEQVMEWQISDPQVILEDGDEGYLVLDRAYQVERSSEFKVAIRF